MFKIVVMAGVFLLGGFSGILSTGWAAEKLDAPKAFEPFPSLVPEAEETAPLTEDDPVQTALPKPSRVQLSSAEYDQYLVGKKQSYQRILELQLDKYDVMIKELVLIAKDMKRHFSFEMQDEFNDLRAKNLAIRYMLAEISRSDLSAWPEMKRRSDEAAREFEAAYDRANEELSNLIRGHLPAESSKKRLPKII